MSTRLAREPNAVAAVVEAVVEAVAEAVVEAVLAIVVADAGIDNQYLRKRASL